MAGLNRLIDEIAPVAENITVWLYLTDFNSTGTDDGNQPNTRNMNKDMSKVWGEKISSKELFDLFPGGPSKQAGRIDGLPVSRRKGGY